MPLKGQDPGGVVRDLVANVVPHDEQEAEHQAAMLKWVDSEAQLFRLQKPITPPQHLAVYAVLLDEVSRSIMLVAHTLAKAWLMPGGHVDDGEDPELRSSVKFRSSSRSLRRTTPTSATALHSHRHLDHPPFTHQDATF